MSFRSGLLSALLPTVLLATPTFYWKAGIGAAYIYREPLSAACLATDAPQDSFVVVALTQAGSRLVVLGANSGALLHSFPLGPVRHPLGADSASGYFPDGSLALNDRTCEVIVGTVDSLSGITRVTALSMRDWQLRAVTTIQDTAGFSWVDIGRSSGRLYLMAHRGMHVTVIDRTTGAIVGTAFATRVGYADRTLFRARVAPDEQRVYFAYHGGLDWIDLATSEPCPDPVFASYPLYRISWGCREDVHGDFSFVGNDIVAATGDSYVLIYDSTVTFRRKVAIGGEYALGHFMWPGVDERTGMVYGTTYCRGGSGILAVNVVQPFARTQTVASTACGQRLTPTSDSKFLLGLDFQYQTIQVVDLRRGVVIRSFDRTLTGGFPIDMLGVGVERP